MKPTGREWRIWKKREFRRLAREGKPIPTDWNAHWEAKHGAHHPGTTESEQVRLLTIEVARLKREAVTHAMVREEILGLASADPEVPGWVLDTGTSGTPGIPTLFASDWHWGERIDPRQIGNVNAYDLSIARSRAHRLIENAVNLLKNHMVNPNYPGIVFALGGDMFSGDIHDELSRTNEAPIMPVVLDLYGVLIWCIETLADEFGRVFVPAVSGNHSRTTHKPHSKDRNHLNFDWLLYCLLERHFQGDDRIRFFIPDGPDAVYTVAGHVYCLTHGDQFRGGDGMIGAAGPIIRGDRAKRSRNGQIGHDYDTLMLGHWHQYNPGKARIWNGCLCGYNEYANAKNFEFEPPQQALWITHPRRGITFHAPVFVDDLPEAAADDAWVSWRSA